MSLVGLQPSVTYFPPFLPHCDPHTATKPVSSRAELILTTARRSLGHQQYTVTLSDDYEVSNYFGTRYKFQSLFQVLPLEPKKKKKKPESHGKGHGIFKNATWKHAHTNISPSGSPSSEFSGARILALIFSRGSSGAVIIVSPCLTHAFLAAAVRCVFM